MSRRDEFLLKQAKKKATSSAYSILISAFIVALHDEFGFDESRLDQLMLRVVKECDAMGRGMIGYIDYREYAEEKTGLNLGDYYEEL